MQPVAARRAGDRAAGLRPLHMVSTFLVREGLTVAQEPYEAKSNKITALPRLLAHLVLEAAVVTIDAAGCQTTAVLAPKPNQRTCTGPRGHRQRAVRYYISSRPPAAIALLALVSGHWNVENGLRRTLDVQFREDDCRIRKGHAPPSWASCAGPL